MFACSCISFSYFVCYVNCLFSMFPYLNWPSGCGDCKVSSSNSSCIIQADKPFADVKLLPQRTKFLFSFFKHWYLDLLFRIHRGLALIRKLVVLSNLVICSSSQDTIIGSKILSTVKKSRGVGDARCRRGWAIKYDADTPHTIMLGYNAVQFLIGSNRVNYYVKAFGSTAITIYIVVLITFV